MSNHVSKRNVDMWPFLTRPKGS